MNTAINLKLILGLISVLLFKGQEGDLLFSNGNHANLVSLDTLVFEIYNDNLNANSEYEINVYSPNFKEILGFQFAFDLSNFEFDEISSGQITMSSSYYNFDKDQQALKMSWFDPTALPQTYDEMDPLFVLKVKAKRAGLVQDLLSVNEDALKSEAVYLTFNSTPIYLQFKFRNRETTSSIEIEDFTHIFPTQLVKGINQLTINSPNITKAILYTFDGKLVSSHNDLKDSMITINVSTSGLYIIKLFDDQQRQYTEVLTLP